MRNALIILFFTAAVMLDSAAALAQGDRPSVQLRTGGGSAQPAAAAVPSPAPLVGRFTVTTAGETAIMVDSVTGNSWVLNQVKGESGLAVWVGAPRFDEWESFRAWVEYRGEAAERLEMLEKMQDTVEALYEKREQMLAIASDDNKEQLSERYDAQIDKLLQRIEQLTEEAIEADEEFWRSTQGEQPEAAGEEAAIEEDEDELVDEDDLLEDEVEEEAGESAETDEAVEAEAGESADQETTDEVETEPAADNATEQESSDNGGTEGTQDAGEAETTDQPAE